MKVAGMMLIPGSFNDCCFFGMDCIERWSDGAMEVRDDDNSWQCLLFFLHRMIDGNELFWMCFQNHGNEP